MASLQRPGDRRLPRLRGEAVEPRPVVGDGASGRARSGPRHRDARRASSSTLGGARQPGSSRRARIGDGSDEFDARHRGVVAVAGAELEDAGVAAVAVGVAGADLVEQLVRPSPCRRGTTTTWRWLCRPPFLALVMTFSATGRSALALASVVTMPSAATSDATRLAIISRWWAALPPKRRPFFGVAGMSVLSPSAQRQAALVELLR